MKNKGFTLVELLVVIAIIAALAALLLPALQKALKRAHYASWCGLKQSNKNDPNCVGYWTFEETYTEGSDTKVANLADAYTGGLISHTAEDCDGTLLPNPGGPTWIPVGDGRGRFLAKPSLSFDGSNDYVDCGNDASLNITDAITIEAWVKAKVTQVSYPRIAHRVTGASGYDFYLNPSMRLGLHDGSAHFLNPSGTNLNDNVWHHIVVVVDLVDTDTAKFYLDGNQDGNTVDISSIGDISTTADFRISGVNDPFNGLIDEVAIFDVALSASEIKKRYRAGRP